MTVAGTDLPLIVGIAAREFEPPATAYGFRRLAQVRRLAPG